MQGERKGDRLTSVYIEKPDKNHKCEIFRELPHHPTLEEQ